MLLVKENMIRTSRVNNKKRFPELNNLPTHLVIFNNKKYHLPDNLKLCCYIFYIISIIALFTIPVCLCVYASFINEPHKYTCLILID